ncbi:MAG: aminopeptidase [Candidatus Faecimonas sp.]|nr:aminopeptidase [Mycoplasmatota bacterium]MDY2908237.1 aminopeptidase [Candidatus Faecimonas sp.]
MEKKNAWKKYKEEDLKKLNDLCDDYKRFLTVAKTERESANEIIKRAEEKGYQDLEKYISEGRRILPGDKIYVNNKGKAVALFNIGKEPITNGMNILGAHIDSPRIDLKANPLYESEGFAYFDTHYYGGIKKYQWVTLPLALHGVVVKKDGTKIDINIGEKEDDPVFGITDLLPHLAGEQMKKESAKLIEGENLDIIIGNKPLSNNSEEKNDEKEEIKTNILNILKEQYDITEDDFLSAEIEAVPAGKARDFGLDRSMIMAYGQDDRVCAYTSLEAFLQIEDTMKTLSCILVDKEEIGSVGATGMESHFFDNAIAEICALMGNDSSLAVRRVLNHSKMLSSDVNAAYDPLYKSVMDKRNSSQFGHGLVFCKYTGARGKSGSNDANAEYIAELRKIMDEENIAFQISELGKVDAGGGGTIAYILANYNVEVIDCGVGVLSMHAPWEVTSKSDIYEAYRGYIAFLQNA